MATIGKLNVLISANSGGLQKELGKTQSALGGLKGGADKGGQGLSGLSVGAGLATAALTALLAVAAVGGLGVKMAADLEQATLAFEVMIGSAQRAQQLVTDMRKFAAATPFETEDLIKSGRVLIAFGASAENVIPTVSMLGDIASATNQPLEEMSMIYGKISTKGRAMTRDLNELSSRGVPVIRELAKQFGVAESEVYQLAEGGKISFADIATSMQRMTSQGGMFYRMMDRQSQTLLGLWSTLKDNVMIGLTDIGQVIIDAFALKGGARGLIGLTGQIREFIAENKPILIQIGTIIRDQIGGNFSAIRAILEPVRVIALAIWQAFSDSGGSTTGILDKVQSLQQRMFGLVPTVEQFRDATIDSLEEAAIAIAELADLWDSLGVSIGKTGRSLGVFGVGLGPIKSMMNAIGGSGALEGIFGTGLGALRAQIASSAEKSTRAGDVREFFDRLRGSLGVARSLGTSIGAAISEGMTSKVGELQIDNVIPPDMIEKARKLGESMLGPMEQYRRQMAEIDSLFTTGILNQDQLYRSYLKEIKDLEKTLNIGEPKFAKAMTAGSADAISAINKWNAAGDRNDPLKRIENLFREAAAQEKRQTAAAEKVANVISKLELKQAEF